MLYFKKIDLKSENKEEIKRKIKERKGRKERTERC